MLSSPHAVQLWTNAARVVIMDQPQHQMQWSHIPHIMAWFLAPTCTHPCMGRAPVGCRTATLQPSPSRYTTIDTLYTVSFGQISTARLHDDVEAFDAHACI